MVPYYVIATAIIRNLTYHICEKIKKAIYIKIASNFRLLLRTHQHNLILPIPIHIC
jgi:hypothetical protein